MNNNDKELLKTTPSMNKGFAVQSAHLNGNPNASLSFDDMCGMVEFGMALGCQISEAEKVSTAKLTTECAIGGFLFGCFIGLLAANLAKRSTPKCQHNPLFFPELNNIALEAKRAAATS